jgi:hypothetical protein
LGFLHVVFKQATHRRFGELDEELVSNFEHQHAPQPIDPGRRAVRAGLDSIVSASLEPALKGRPVVIAWMKKTHSASSSSLYSSSSM